jgi:hypothetical protein
VRQAFLTRYGLSYSRYYVFVAEFWCPSLTLVARLRVQLEFFGHSWGRFIGTILLNMASQGKTYIVEHLDPELGPWSELEYMAIAQETQAAGGKFCLSSLPLAFKVPEALAAVPSFVPETRGVEELYASDKARVCLLDPAAAKDLSPEDGDAFDAFLFGGILGKLDETNVSTTNGHG